MITRRKFLQSCAVAAGYSVLSLGKFGFAMAADAPAYKRLIVIMLRGAVDGLSVVVPYGDKNYYAHRTSIALAPPGQEGGALNLDGYFGLHPSLAPLMPFWNNRSLAFVHACGVPSNVRSHFEAQDIIETASLHPNAAQDGWMSALLNVLPKSQSKTRVLSFSGELPRILVGKANIASVPNKARADGKIPMENPKVASAFSQLYAGHPELNALYQDGIASRTQLMESLQKEMEAANNHAPYPDGFPRQVANLAAMIKHDDGIQLAFIDLGGWDTHAGQGNAKGTLASRLEKLGEGLAVLAQQLGTHYDSTAIMVISEFGRTVSENGNGGTDHGHGNVAWLMGGNINGGKVYGRWPGLAQNQLFEGRDLDVTTDFRSVIAAVLHQHMGVDDVHIAQVLSDYKSDAAMNGLYHERPL